MSSKAINSWHSISLKRIGTLEGGTGFPIEEQGLGNDVAQIPFFKVKDLSSKKNLFITDNYISYETVKKLGASIHKENTIVFAKIGAALLLNRFRILKTIGCIDNNLMAYTTNNGILDPSFCYYFFFNFDMAAICNPGPVPSVNTKYLGYEKIALPALSEQRRIAAFLDKRCAAIDGAIAAKEDQIVALGNTWRFLIHNAVTRGVENEPRLRPVSNDWLPSLPAGWDLIQLKRVSSLQGGLTLGASYEGELIERPYLRVANVQDGFLDLGDVSLIEVPLSVAKSVELQKNDVLMSEGGDLDKLGRGCVWSGQIEGCLHQNHIFAIRCFEHKLRPQFLAYLTSSQYGRDYFEATGKRTTNLATTNSTKVGEFYIPLPSLRTQDRIIQYLDAKYRELGKLKANLADQISTLRAYRKSLIHECVTGQRRV